MRRLWPAGGLWRHPDFLKLWTAETISVFGAQFTALALPLVAVLLLDASAFAVSALFVVEFLPFILFAIPAGVWVDRLPRRPILVIGDIGRAALLGSIPLAYLFDALHARTAVRGRLPRRDLHGLLRRRVPVVSPLARGARAARRRQLEARDQPVDLAAGRAGHGGRSDRRLRSALRDAPRRDQLRGLSRLPLCDPEARDAAGARGGRRAAEHARRRARGAPLRDRQPLPPADLDLHRHVELLLEHGRGAARRLRRPRARDVGGVARHRVLDREHRCAGRRRHDKPHLRVDSASGRRS